jgi:cytochrome P450
VSDTASRLAAVEESFQKLQGEYDNLSAAIGDPLLTPWIADRGRAAPRKLTAFEAATVRRLASLEPKLDALEDELDELRARLVCELAGVPSDSDVGDPEILLRAALVVLHREHKAARSTVVSRAVMRALIDYLKSLAEDDENG